ncbi:helix-turn-helix domain-containing protein [Erythrobacter sp. SD-21]|uniref:AraC family transcriptional regulator n=1 Tax=Erythrobacter sp. SD-21 TaxID=161528 RepID=UPI000305F9E8|nr:helix-turn-helix domain-containing protein [Erythrobacter sp. SD-21]
MRFFAPPEDLAPCFTTFYKMEVDLPSGEVLEDLLQPEWGNLRFFKHNPPLARPLEGGEGMNARFQATGPSSHPMQFRIGRTSMWGIGLLPLGWARFVQVPADRFVDTICDGEASDAFAKFAPLREMFWHEGQDAYAEFAAISQFFRDLAPMPKDADRILEIHEAMIDPYLLEVTTLADRVGLTKRTLERVCARHFGFPPRLLLRRQRMMRSLANFMLSESQNWSETIDRHYHDQAHFVHEFHNFMGMSPSQYAQREHPVLEAFMSERQRIWGSPVQTLDAPRHAESHGAEG